MSSLIAAADDDDFELFGETSRRFSLDLRCCFANCAFLSLMESSVDSSVLSLTTALLGCDFLVFRCDSSTMDFFDAIDRDGTAILKGATVDPCLHRDMCLRLKLQIAFVRVGAVVAVEGTLDVDRIYVRYEVRLIRLVLRPVTWK